MRRTLKLLPTLLAMVPCLPLPLLGAGLSEKHKTWLEEEAVYLITSREREVFLKLPNDEDRDRFIGAFWQARDPTPGTTRNEFREEFERRRQKANELFRGYGRPGWKGDRGRIYIMLGPPRERKSFDSTRELWPVELWFYQVDEPRLPAFFYIVFYQRGGAGDFRLWDPIGEGPPALLATSVGNPAFYDRARVLAALESVDSDLYQAVLSPVPGGGSGTSAALEYQKVLAVLEDFPNNTLAPAYADRYRPGQGIVEVDYLFRELNVLPLVTVLPSAEGWFVHYALDIAPQDLTFAQYKTTFFTVFDVEAELQTPDGRPVYQLRERREVELSEEEFETARERILSLEGRFPVVPGEFRLRFLIRSLTGRVYDTLEASVSVPETLRTSEIVPARSFKRRDGEPTELAFQLGGMLALPNPGASFPVGGNLRSFLLLAPDFPPGPVAIEGKIVQEGKTVHRIERNFPHDPAGEPAFIGLDVSLGGLPPGAYSLELLLAGGERRVLPFTVGDAGTLPLVNSPEEAPSRDAKWQVERARQFLALEQNRNALGALEKAVERNPELETVRVQAALLALGLGEPERALAAALPGLMRAPFHYELLTLAGYASERLDKPEDAARYYERARATARADEKLLRALAGVYEKLGKKDKAESIRKEIPREDPR
jgi:GWxTD domain-containing protein